MEKLSKRAFLKGRKYNLLKRESNNNNKKKPHWPPGKYELKSQEVISPYSQND